MKALIIADNQTVIEKIQEILETNGYDTIIYRWLLKALDNFVEISPDVMIISAYDYPRHWKTMAQYAKSGIIKKTPKIVIYQPKTTDKNEIEKEEALGITGFFTNIDEKGISALVTLLNCSKKSEKTDNIDLVEDSKSNLDDEDEVPTVCDLVGKDFVEKHNGTFEGVSAFLKSFSFPSVDNIIHEQNAKIPSVDELIVMQDAVLPTVDNLIVVKNAFITSVDELSDCLPEIKKSIDIPKVDSLEEIPLKTDLYKETVFKEKSETENESAGTEIPAVDDLVVTQSAVVPSVDNLIEEPDCQLPRVDNLFTENERISVIPTVGQLFTALHNSERFDHEIPTVDSLFVAGTVLIPSVDDLLYEPIPSKKHSLLAKCQELYGEK